ncbi:ribonuclease E/G [Primorskyibacter flagellatus]|uniref:Ribonuclease E n=1 Tax=Primorskyibacter flagellatus TaxID=1387277 RepID=A0A1W2BP30_9RHOB|nr:ribonuclease E/G [Primorskyibacter flagellatus]SMC74623.1 RNAse E [Primorskyibacter flagellatus]
MAKKMLIDATHAEETRVVVVDGTKVEEFDFESENKRQLAGNIYLAKVTRVEPSLQAAFVDYGGNRHGFLAFSEIHPDYYQIPVADREALMEEERAYAEAMRARDEDEEKPKSSRSRSRSRKSAKPENAKPDDLKVTQEVAKPEGQISGMETIDLDEDEVPEGSSPMETVAETPVEEPSETVTEQATDLAETDAALVEGAEDASDDETDDAESDDEQEDDANDDASSRDSSIESVADEDDQEDIRPVRKPRPRRYKIQEVIKVRQILLVQVVKEERGNKGAALTTYLSLAGRYCVLMPNTARGGGISRKITNAVDRKKLKEIASEIEVPKGAGLIVRTAGAKRTKSEIKRDYEYLQRLWEQIRELTLKSIAPAKIYEEGDLIKRSIRDLYSREIDEVLVEGERGYRIAKDFMKMIMPSHAKNVKHYAETLPLFARYQVESYLSSMFNPTVQLKSGGYIVIGVTEALVAIDVNSGRATKEGSIEETALKTNMEAAEEVARQLRLRDLAGLIVIDFIDMDERKNNASVEKKIKDKLKTDRARIQVGRISGFGLMEMSRQRLRPGMIEATTQPCTACHGTGLIRSDDNLSLSILRQVEEEGTRGRSREVLVKCPVGIANFLMNQKREHIAQIEARYGMSVRIEGEPALVSPDFTLEKFKTATRKVAEIVAPVVSVDTSLMDQIDEDESHDTKKEEAEEATVTEAKSSDDNSNNEADEDGKPKKRRRRRRRGRSKSNGSDGNGENGENRSDDTPGEEAKPAADAEEPQSKNVPEDDKVAIDAPAEVPAVAAEATQTDVTADASAQPETTAVEGEQPGEGEADVAAPKKPATRSRAKPKSTATKAPAKPRTTRSRAKPKTADNDTDTPAPVETSVEPIADVAQIEDPTPGSTLDVSDLTVPESPTVSEPSVETVVETPPQPEPVAAPEPEAAPEPMSEVAAPQPVVHEDKELATASADTETAEADDKDKPKRRGWWSLGR